MEKRTIHVSNDARRRFWANVAKDQGCWVWKGGVLREGSYGRMMVDGERFLAHRLSFAIEHGWLPVRNGQGKELIICHHCDNKPCVRPDHLYIGTHSQNSNDAIERKLMIPVNGHPFGEMHPNAKLTGQQAEEIRRIYAAGGFTQRELGLRFGISQTQVSEIVRGRAYIRESA